MTQSPIPVRVGYFSMEIALDPDVPTYSGGLGILAGDTLRSAADVGLPIAGVTLLFRKGYFEQHLDELGNQTETPSNWNPEKLLTPLEPRVEITLEGRSVKIRAWQYSVRGLNGHVVPVYLLDTSLPENSAYDQTLTDTLYSGGSFYRLCQEAVLGLGGVEMLRALGHHHIMTYHMNEGHSSLLTLSLLDQHLAGRPLEALTEDDLAYLRKKCVFTTHTPVPAGHDQFPKEMVRRALGDARVTTLEQLKVLSNGELNMTSLGLRGSHYINGVAMLHGEVSRGMFPEYSIHAITNGVHAPTWISPAFQELFDRHVPEWRRDNLYLRYAIGIPHSEIRNAHNQSKRALLEEIHRRLGVELDESILTLGFARRAATYKRAAFLFSDVERVKWIAQNIGPFQVIFAGKAHPYDEPGKAMIRRVFEVARTLKDAIRIVYVPNYEMRWAQFLTSGVDVWLNTPQRPYEASGTSGMKAALNGVPSLSVPDGWWIEGHVEGATGWDIGHQDLPDSSAEEIGSLYDKLENVVIPMFYGNAAGFGEVMRNTIALNGSFFNTQRMIAQYILNAYFSGQHHGSVERTLDEVRQAPPAGAPGSAPASAPEPAASPK
jgi:glycogen phosphorylase